MWGKERDRLFQLDLGMILLKPLEGIRRLTKARNPAQRGQVLHHPFHFLRLRELVGHVDEVELPQTGQPRQLFESVF